MRVPEDLVEIRLRDPEDFLKIRETLTRIGTAHQVDGLDVLVQVCHILHKRGLYYITHYKEMMILDGKSVSMDESDISKRDVIVNLLAKWGLCEIVDTNMVSSPEIGERVKVVPYREKNQWLLKCKYEVGKKNRDAVYFGS